MKLTVLQKVGEHLAQGIPLSEEQARLLIREEPEVALFLLLEYSQLLHHFRQQKSGQPSLSTPSGMIPVYWRDASSH
ncbi:MAG: hypothetical protein ACOX5R_05195 [bacterium]|jgi:hypothetical protein